MNALIDIGNQIQLDANTDPNNIVNNQFRDKMNKIDLIPVNPQINVNTGDEDVKGLVGYVYSNRIAKYRSLCKQYISEVDPTVAGLRIWTTAESSITESIYNAFEQNSIERGANSFSSQYKGIRDTVNATYGGGTANAGAAVDELAGSALNKAIDLLKFQSDHADNVTQAASDTLNWIISGSHISLPKIWTSTSYVPSASVKVKLISPSGSPRSIRKHILDPLLYLLILISPESTDGLTYSNVSYLRVKAYGLSNMNLGYVESVALNRGGEAETFNKYMQPLSIELTLTIRAAFDGFAVINKGHENGVKSGVIEQPLNDSNKAQFQSYKDENNRYGLTSIDNVIDSFRKYKPADRPDLPSNPLINTGASTAEATEQARILNDAIRTATSIANSQGQPTESLFDQLKELAGGLLS